ncbi:MAG: serine/threonine protein kinase [Candidatus Wallbacteria bacterium]|nr:serine/threonine protein kinase [Candidatus Wallbacteria bacterium]
MQIVGKTLGRYRVLADVGQGAMAAVYQAKDESTGRIVALKILPGQMTRDAERLRRFKREYRILAELDHPNIIHIYDADEADGLHFYTMQYLEHPTLQRVIQRYVKEEERTVPVERATAILANLLAGLEYIHSRGVVHRDIKPANCYIPADDSTILADFGLVKATAMTAITMAPSFIGTPEYASPEQIMVDKSVDERSDLYQAGLLFYEMVAGRLPFSSDLESIIGEKCLADGVKSPRVFNPALSSKLESLVLKATTREVTQRFQTAAQMRAELLQSRAA